MHSILITNQLVFLPFLANNSLVYNVEVYPTFTVFRNQYSNTWNCQRLYNWGYGSRTHVWWFVYVCSSV